VYGMPNSLKFILFILVSKCCTVLYIFFYFEPPRKCNCPGFSFSRTLSFNFQDCQGQKCRTLRSLTLIIMQKIMQVSFCDLHSVVVLADFA